MPVTVRCPGCSTALRVLPDWLGRPGACAKCGLVFRLATPVGQRLADDELDEAQVILEPQVARPRVQRRAMLVALFAFFACLGAFTFFWVRQQADPNPQDGNPEVAVAPGSNPSANPDTNPGSEGMAQAPAPRPVVRTGRPVTLDLGGKVDGLYPGGGGRYVVFHLLAAERIAVYDAHEGKMCCTIAGTGKGHVAVNRDKIFVGRWSDGQITRYDLRTGEKETVGGPPEPEKLHQLAAPSGADGPLVSAGVLKDKVMIRLYDPGTMEEYKAPIEIVEEEFDPGPTRFPFGHPLYTDVALSADGRVIGLCDCFYHRTAKGYLGRRIASGTAVRPNNDGTGSMRYRLFTEFADVPEEFPDKDLRRLVPAANGPFFLSLVYHGTNVGRLTLHVGTETVPLGDLPDIPELKAWVRKDDYHMTVLERHLTFLPEPGLLVFAPGGPMQARTSPVGSPKVHIVPVDLPAMLAKSDRRVLFTSVPPAMVPKNRKYEYTATAVTADGGKPTFSLQSGPPGMAVTPDGKLMWSPDASFRETKAEVWLVARGSAGKPALQQFRLFLQPR